MPSLVLSVEDSDLTRANRNVTCSNRRGKNVTLDITQQSWTCQLTHTHDVLYLSKIKWWWWLHGWRWPLRIAKLLALILDLHQQKWHALYVCVWVCYSSLQQNSISCLHLSRLIILRSISFKQETSHFLSVFLSHSRTVSGDILIFHPVLIRCDSHSNLAPPTCWGGSDTWRQRLILFPSPPPTHRCRRYHLRPTKREARCQGFPNFKFCCWLSGKNNPLRTLFCLITFYSRKGNLKDKSLIRHKPLSILSAWGWLRCVFVCVWYGKGRVGRWWWGWGSSIILWFQNGTFSQINMSDCYLNHWNSQWDAIFSYMNHVEEGGHSHSAHPLTANAPATEVSGLSTVVWNLAWC